MKRIDGNILRYAVLSACCFVLITQPGCSSSSDFNGHRVKKRPRARVGRYASPTVGTVFVDTADLGKHGYYNGWSEKVGIIYTCKAGHIDLAHVRKSADWTCYLAANIAEQLRRNATEFSYKFKEPSRYYVKIEYPPYWRDLPQAEKDRIAQDISIRLGQYFAYVGCTWHEILTWFGYRSVGIYPEFPSAFSWEDSFSDLLGTHIGAKALRDTEHRYDEAVTLALNRELEELGVQPREVCIKASQKVRGLWFSGDFLFLVNMKGRNFDIGLDDGRVTPWLVPSLEECEGAAPRSYRAPEMDFLEEYGFTVKLELEPRELERRKILSIVYPDKQQRKKRIEPAVHFEPIMEYIRNEAVNKYGYHIGPLETVQSARAGASESGSESAALDEFFNDLDGGDLVDFLDFLAGVDAWLVKSAHSLEDVQ